MTGADTEIAEGAEAGAMDDRDADAIDGPLEALVANAGLGRRTVPLLRLLRDDHAT